MFGFWEGTALFVGVLSLVLIIIGFVIIPLCKRRLNIAERSRQNSFRNMNSSIPYEHHTSFTISVPSVPPYFYTNEFNFDAYNVCL